MVLVLVSDSGRFLAATDVRSVQEGEHAVREWRFRFGESGTGCDQWEAVAWTVRDAFDGDREEWPEWKPDVTVTGTGWAVHLIPRRT